jgi:hypothetical protein
MTIRAAPPLPLNTGTGFKNSSAKWPWAMPASCWDWRYHASLATVPTGSGCWKSVRSPAVWSVTKMVSTIPPTLMTDCCLASRVSEAEVHVLKARLLGGLLNKARRGELAVPLPIGLVYDAIGAVALDPDRQIQNAVRMIFDTFRQSGSARVTLRRFQREALQFPQRTRGRSGTGEVNWVPLEYFRVLQILHNPRYAGAFVFGRRRSTRTVDLKSTTHLQTAPEDWTVLIREAHPGYIAWEEFERNQTTLRENLGPYTVTRRGTLPREGSALLQGHVLCGLCGARMRTRYEQFRGGVIPYYVCTEESVRRAGKTCQ